MTMYEQMMFDFGDPPKVDDMLDLFKGLLEDAALDHPQFKDDYFKSIDDLRNLLQACRDLVEAYSEPGDEEGTHYFLNPDKGWSALAAAMHEMAA